VSVSIPRIEDPKRSLATSLCDIALALHVVLAALWWWLMHGGFPVTNLRYWSNGVLPCLALVSALLAIWAGHTGRSALRLASVIPLVAAWSAFAVSARAAFPITFRILWVIPVFIGLVLLAAALMEAHRNGARARPLWIGLAGPAVNLLIAGGIALWFWREQTLVPLPELLKPTDANLAQRIGVGNLLLGVFNLLPAFPMDGGRVLRSLLSRFRPEEEATRIAAATGQFLAIGMGLVGLLSGNFMLSFIALFAHSRVSCAAAVPPHPRAMATALVRIILRFM